MTKKQSKILSHSFTEVLPFQQYKNQEGGWRDGMVTGNGHVGVICSGSPYNETLIYQDIEFIMPSSEPRKTPKEVTAQLHEARQAVINFDDTWNVHDRKRTYLYCYHPAHQLRLALPKEDLLDYCRHTDHETAEVSVKYTDNNGTWERSTFSSREDNATITKITKSDQNAKIDVVISIDDPVSLPRFGKQKHGVGPELDMQYKQLGDEECSYLALVAHYPAYEGSELADGGYAGVSRVITKGGKKEQVLVNGTPAIKIVAADSVYIITQTARTHQMGKLSEFADQYSYELVDQLVMSTKNIASHYTDKNGIFNYDLALEPHCNKHAKLFNAVSFSLGTDQEQDINTESLLAKQKTAHELLPAMVKKVYDQGRYAQICCAGYSAPRLCGLWTGEWNPGWRGAYTMDANVNLQVSGMNTGNVYDAAIGYIYFVLRQIDDWQMNATDVYGMENALLTPVNTDGDRAVMVEYDQHYPFQYWNAGASWMLQPIFEFWQCFGNCQIPVKDHIINYSTKEYLDLEQDILYPLLNMQANFWAQLCTPEYYTDLGGKACYQEGKQELEAGEKYLIIPSYSPENRPLGYKSPITANATMDISAARDGLQMVIAIEEALKKTGYEQAVKKWEQLLADLPDYKYDDTNALREWVMNEYEENNAHRHISHLYCAWPGHETQHDEQLATGCKTSIANRNRENDGKDDTASHGWVHRALVAARLKDGESVDQMLHTLLSSDIYFSSLMTDHNTDRSKGVYCTDTSIGTVGIINELLLYSHTGEIELLPALPKRWVTGAIKGLMARTRAEVTNLEWDLSTGKIRATIRSDIDQEIMISCPLGNGFFITATDERYANNSVLKFAKNEEINLEIVTE